MTILFTKKGKDAKKIEKSSMGSEKELQSYMLENPDIIPLSDIDDTVRLQIITREFPTQVGSIDAIGVDDSGQVYLIETKLYKNTDKRRVIAQVLDYGAALWKNYGHDDFDVKLGKQIIKYSNSNTIQDRLKEKFQIDTDEANEIFNNMKENIRDGNFKFIILMDRVHADLKNLILFLNENSRFDIYAVEIEYYKYEENEITIPKIFGGGVRKTTNRTGGIYDEDHHLNGRDESIKAIYHKLKQEIVKFGDDVTQSYAKLYIVFKKNNGFASIELMKGFVNVVINLDKGKLDDPEGLTEDVYNKGKHGVGDYRMRVESIERVDQCIPLIKQAYMKN